MSNCLFCKIVNKEIPSYTLYEDEDFMVFLDVFPSSLGHALIVPKNHYTNIYEMDEKIIGKGFIIASKLAKYYKEFLKCDGVNILQNNEIAAGQTVFHFHIHVIPRYDNDNVSFSWVNSKITEIEFTEFVKKSGFSND